MKDHDVMEKALKQFVDLCEDHHLMDEGWKEQPIRVMAARLRMHVIALRIQCSAQGINTSALVSFAMIEGFFEALLKPTRVEQPSDRGLLVGAVEGMLAMFKEYENNIRKAASVTSADEDRDCDTCPAADVCDEKPEVAEWPTQKNTNVH